MKKLLIVFVLLLTAHCSLLTAFAQGTPGTVRYPSQLDTPDSLIRIKDTGALTTLSGTITSSSTSLTTPANGTAKFDSSGAIKVDDEIIYYTSKTSTTFAGLVRGACGTTAVRHNGGSAIRSPLTACHHSTLAEAIIAIETAAGGGGDLLAANNLSDLANAATARTNLGLGNINNTSDANKPVSTAQQTALDLKQNVLGYSPAQLTSSISDSDTTHAPDGNSVFDALALKVPTSYLDTDTSLAANSDSKIATQKAVKAYADAHAGTPYDLALSFDGAPSASASVRFVAVRAFNLPSSFTGTTCSAGTAATAQTDFLVNVKRSGVDATKATLRFGASGTTCTIVSGTATSIVAGDVITIVAPGSPDATLADIALTLKGSLP